MIVLVRFLAIAFLSSICLQTYAQDISAKYPTLIKRVKQINEDKTLTVLFMDNQEFLSRATDGGGELTGLLKNGQIQKITRNIGLSHGVEVFDYYFTNGELIFVYETFSGFSYNGISEQFDYSKTERNFIGRYYFKHGKLIDYETTGHNRFEDDRIDIETTLTDEMTDCLEKLNKKLADQTR